MIFQNRNELEDKREREGGKNRRPKKEIILLENEMKNIRCGKKKEESRSTLRKKNTRFTKRTRATFT